MKERPILFSTPMVRAILSGEKTQTRRIAKARFVGLGDDIPENFVCPYGRPGDRFWVRETFFDATKLAELSVLYRADGTKSRFGWTPCIHMPRWASRITLEITGVRVERLNDISESDAWAEGCLGFDDDVTGGKSGYGEFSELWESINGPGSWNANPFVWVIEFKQIKEGQE